MADGKKFLRKLEFSVLPNVSKPERYIGGESGTIIKKNADIRFCLVFAETYEIGMSNIGLQILYNQINETENALCELSFCPWKDMEAKLKETQIPLYSHTTYTPLKKFDIIGISTPHEMCYTNIFTILSTAQIPFEYEKRPLDKYPLLIAGGAISSNPKPVEKIFDLIAIGEGEELIKETIKIFQQYKHLKNNKKEFLSKFKHIEGLYIPMLKNNVKRVFLEKLDKRLIKQHIISNTAPVHDRCVVEIARGCKWGCRFCQAGYIYRPYREKPFETAIEEALHFSAVLGTNEISFLSLSSSDYKNLKDIIKFFKTQDDLKNIIISFPSMRIEENTLLLLKELYTKKRPTITLAPEAGSERMINIIGKKIKKENFIKIAKELFKLGWKNLKLYFMIGLPFETKEDILGICRLMMEISSARKEIDGKFAQINATISNFIPKPHTPFQWARQNSVEELLEKQNLIKRNIKNKFIKPKFHSPYQSMIEGILSRGDEKTYYLIKKSWEKGARFDNWKEEFDFNTWKSAIEDLNFDYNEILKEKLLDHNLPWDNIQIMTNKKILENEWKKAKNAAL